MRKAIGAFVIVALAVAALLAIAATNLNAYLDDNKDWIAAQIESALARPVRFDAAELSLGRGLAVKIEGLRVGEDERYAEGEFLSVGEAEVRVALWPALFGDVEITKVSLRDVSLNVIQTESGLSTDSLGAISESGREPAPAADPGAAKTAPAAPADAFVIAMAEIRSGRIRYVDRRGDSQREVVLDQLEFSTTDVGLSRPLEFQCTAGLLGNGDANLEIAGRVGPLASLPGAETPLDVEFAIDPIVSAALRDLPGLADAIDPELPLAGSMKLSGRLTGSLENPSLEFDLDASDALLSFGAERRKRRGAVLRVGFEAALSGQDLDLRRADLEVEGVVLHASGSVVDITDPSVDISIEVFGGTIKLDGGWARDGRLDFDTRLSDLEFGEMIRSFAPDSAGMLDGRLSMSLAVTGSGSTWEELKLGLAGLGDARIEGGTLHDINLVEEALAGLTGIAGLSFRLPPKMREKYPRLFGSGNTEFERMQGKLEVRDGRVHILGFELAAADYGLRGWGSVSLDGDLDMTTRVVLSESLTGDLIEIAKPLKYLRGKKDRLEIPVELSGELPEVSVRPDADLIAKKIAAGATKKLAKKSLRKLIKKRKKKKKSARPANAAGARDLLRGLLRDR